MSKSPFVNGWILLVVLTTGALAQDGAETNLRPIDRRFTFVDDTLHGGLQGHWEYEQWVTAKGHSDEDSAFKRVDFKHELEYGLTQDIHVAFEFANWHWQQDEEGHGTCFDTVGGEVKFRLLDPRTDAIGFGFKTEVETGPHTLEWANKVIVDKVIDRWEFAYNATLEAKWGGDSWFGFSPKENEGEIVQSAGVSYEVTPSFYLGAEAMYGIPLPNWHSGEDTNFFVGPNVAYHGNDWAVGVTALFLVNGGPDEPKFQIRAIFEIDF